jgi:hypothetical protein
MRHIAALSVVFGFIVVVSGADIPPPHEVDVATLVQQLGSEDFYEREAATEKLSRLAVDEPPAELLAALKSPNPEVRDRAAKAVKAIRVAAPLRRLYRDERFAALGQVDLFVASTVSLKLKPEDERLWVPAFTLGSKAVTVAEMKDERKPLGPTSFTDFLTYRAKLRSEFVRTDGIYTRAKEDATGKLICTTHVAVQAAEVKAEHVLAGLVVSRGPVSAEKRISDSLILALGDVTAEDEIFNSVVICDGDIVTGYVNRSLLIARGKIDVGPTASSTLVAGRTIKAGLPAQQLAPIPANIGPAALKARVALKEILRVDIKEKERNPLNFITFFELSTIGVEVKVADAAVQVSAIAEGKPFAKAGIRMGDTITEVNGKKPDSAELLRRLLRDALAIGDANVTLRRGEKTETVKVSLPE